MIVAKPISLRSGFCAREAKRRSSLALCQQVRGMWRGNGAGAPMVVVVSAFHDPVYKVRGTLAGAEDFLGKPLDPAALERVMQRHGLRLAPSVRPATAATITPSMPV